MEEVKELVFNIISKIVDDPSKIEISSENTEKGYLLEIKVSESDIGKVIGKSGRVASAIRTVAKAAGAKRGFRVMINVFNKPQRND